MKTGMQVVGFLVAALFYISPCVAAYAADEGAMIHKPLVVHGGKKGDSFTLYFPVELTAPGEINVLVRVDSLDPKPLVHNFEPLRVVIVDSRAFKKMEPSDWKKFCIEVNKYNAVEWIAGDEIRSFVKGVQHLFGGGKEKPPAYFHGEIASGTEGKSESIKHLVDDPELVRTQGRYVVMVRNIEPFKVNGAIMIKYPGTVWDFDPAVLRSAKVRPDLQVEAANYNSNGFLEARVVNSGAGALHKGYWHLMNEKAVTLVAKAGGRTYSVPLQEFDPKQQLQKPGVSVTYVFADVRNINAGSPSVGIDPTDQVFEENENNNELPVSFGIVQNATTGKSKNVSRAAQKPDLTVASIRLNVNKVIEVVIQNSGIVDLDQMAWGSANAPHLNLKMNGNGWANIPLNALDPDRSLSRPGRTAVYSTGYVLRQSAEIAATIDAANIIDETDEGNNTFRVVLHP